MRIWTSEILWNTGNYCKNLISPRVNYGRTILRRTVDIQIFTSFYVQNFFTADGNLETLFVWQNIFRMIRWYKIIKKTKKKVLSKKNVLSKKKGFVEKTIFWSEISTSIFFKRPLFVQNTSNDLKTSILFSSWFRRTSYIPWSWSENEKFWQKLTVTKRSVSLQKKFVPKGIVPLPLGRT